VNADCLKLTVYFGERDRAGGRFLADALSEIYARHQLQTSLVMRGIAGFGIRQHLHTDRLLTLSEDLPLVSVAVDAQSRIERALTEVRQLQFDGLVTLERGRMLTGDIELPRVRAALGEETKLTVYVGRHARTGGKPTYETVVDLLRSHGLAGATVLLGTDGTVNGSRERARFFGTNARVPLMIIAVGDGQRIAEALPELAAVAPRSVLTLERVRVCKRDGRKIAEPQRLPDTDVAGLGIWQKLMIYVGEQARADGEPLHHQLIRSLRRHGASGATSLRGIWGYHGDHEPHGDSFWQLRRRVPVVTVIVDTPARIRRWFDVVDEITAGTGLVTSEIVPAFRSTGPSIEHGGLDLALLEDGDL
jgi:PII-like signaling protein